MQSRREGHASSNKYNVAVSTSSSPNRRVLLAIVVAITLVVVIVLVTFIPIYVTSRERDESADEKESEQQRGEGFNTKFTTRSEVTLHPKPRSSGSPDFYKSPSQLTPEISANSSPISSSSTADISLRITSSLMISHSSSSVQEESSTSPSEMISSVNSMQFTASSKFSVSFAADLWGSSEKSSSVTAKLFSRSESADTDTKTLFPSPNTISEIVTTSLLRESETRPSSNITGTTVDSRQAKASLSLQKTVLLTTTTNVISPTMISSMSDISSASSAAADPSVIANLVLNTAITGTKSSFQPTSSEYQQTPTLSLLELATLATVSSSMTEAPIMPSSRNDVSATSASSVAADLSIIANLLPNTKSKWSRWSSWSGCTQTCGSGTRYRKRTCLAISDTEVSAAPISCAGKSNQVELCAEWSCPDCSRNCTLGTLNAACDACTCNHHLLKGHILSADDLPLSEANISLAETPYNVIAQTNNSGHFTTHGVCAVDQELLVTKEGFIPLTQRANVFSETTATITAKLQIAVPPFITVHPKSEIRMPGQIVTFCCDGKGNPPPEIEWFKENNIIDKEMVNYNSTLEIIAGHGLNGSYRCRVVNAYGSEFSDAADLKIIALAEDSCNPTPSSKIITLPTGCVLRGTNTTTVNIGKCERVGCLKNTSDLNPGCMETSFCCGSRSSEDLVVQCGDFVSFSISKVTQCGCGNCSEKSKTIHGIAQGPDGSPAKSVFLYFGGKIVGKTNYKGIFSFDIPKEIKRALVTFDDRRYKKYETITKVFIVHEGVKMSHKLTLKTKTVPVTFNASEDFFFTLANDSSSGGVADIELPGEALLTEGGDVYRGVAKAAVSFTDPQNLSDIMSAPGDFSTINEEGEQELLQSCGMIKLRLEDDSGKDLALSKPMKVTLDPEKLNLTFSHGRYVSVNLYWLDTETGRWRQVGNFVPEHGSKSRRKRENRFFLTTTVTPFLSRKYLNFDIPTKRVGLRVRTDSDTKDVTVTVISEDVGGYIESSTSGGVACIPIWINTKCVLQAEKDGEYYIPDSEVVLRLPESTKGDIISPENSNGKYESFKFTSNLDTKGPIYLDDASVGGTELTSCKAPWKNENNGRQFIFKTPTSSPTDEYDLFQRNESAVKEFEWRWLEGTSYEEQHCYIKLLMDNMTNSEGILFLAESNRYKNGRYEKLGFHIKKSKPVSNGAPKKHIVCLQFRCPRNAEPTYIFLSPLTSTGASCSSVNTATELKDVQTDSTCSNLPSSQQGAAKWVCVPFSDAQSTIYATFRGDDDIDGDKMGVKRCHCGSQGTPCGGQTTVKNPSLSYDCS